MALFLNKKGNEEFEISNFSNDNTFAKITYIDGNGCENTYLFQYVSFKAPKVPVKELKVLFYEIRDTYGRMVKTGSLYTTIKNGDTQYKLTFYTDNAIASPIIDNYYTQNKFVEDFFKFIYSFNTLEDVYEVCTTNHPTSYSDAISLSEKISKISTILNSLEKGSRGAHYLIQWLKLALLRFEIILKTDDGYGVKTQFSTLDPVFAKHGLALYNK